MPTLTLADGATLTWDDQSVPGPVLHSDGEEPPSSEEPLTVPPEPPVPQAVEQAASAEQPTVTEADVSAALAKVPPKWVATFRRFLKALGAGLASAFVVAGGNIEGIIKDPSAFLAAVGAAVVLAVGKFFSWRDE